jgi:hypothetical protein
MTTPMWCTVTLVQRLARLLVLGLAAAARRIEHHPHLVTALQQ